MGLDAEQLAGKILLKGVKEGCAHQQQHLPRSSRNGWSCTYFTLFQSQPVIPITASSEGEMLREPTVVSGQCLKGKVRYIKNSKSLCRQTLIRISNAQLEVVKSSTGNWGRNST